MGALYIWFARALQWGGTAALGYFSNDIADWVGRVTGTKEQTPGGQGSSRAPWWLVLITLLLAGLLLSWIVRSIFSLTKTKS